MAEPLVMPRESREDFEARYPRPRDSVYSLDYVTRVLVVCTCDHEIEGIYSNEPHWSWGYWYYDGENGDLASEETLAEPAPQLITIQENQ